MSRMKSKLIFVIAILLLLSGCGIISVGYNYADVYLRYSINSYISFDDNQKETIAKEVNVFVMWHRKKMLPEYMEFLQELQRTTQSGAGLKKEDVTRFRAKARSLYVKTLQPAVSPAASLLSGVDPEQIEELVKSFAKENKKKERELGGSLDEKFRKRAEKTIDFLENMVGDFTDKQLEKIREMSRKLPFASSIYIGQQADNQARLIELLKNNKGKDAIAALLSTWLLTPEINRSLDEQRIIIAYENASDAMIVSIYQMLTDSQKKTFQKNILKYINTFQDLASKA